MARPVKSDLLRFFSDIGTEERIRPKATRSAAVPKTPAELFVIAVDKQIDFAKRMKAGDPYKSSYWVRPEKDGRFSVQFGTRALPVDKKKYFYVDTVDAAIELLEKGKGLVEEPTFMKTYEDDRVAQAEKVRKYNANRK
ncbi:hypothetical protein [Rhizobium sp.]|uniref:hypothetical protein n=1 Tax=Rhizobium sp. TaxID=391 RepID=UPI0034C6C26D